MKLPEMKFPTKAQIEASNDHKREKAVRADINKIDALADIYDHTQLLELHRYLDGKYQYCIADWGKSMWGYGDGIGFAYDMLGTDYDRCFLTVIHGFLEWNTLLHTIRFVHCSG